MQKVYTLSTFSDNTDNGRRQFIIDVVSADEVVKFVCAIPSRKRSTFLIFKQIVELWLTIQDILIASTWIEQYKKATSTNI